jgi:hypothetical protein
VTEVSGSAAVFPQPGQNGISDCRRPINFGVVRTTPSTDEAQHQPHHPRSSMEGTHTYERVKCRTKQRCKSIWPSSGWPRTSTGEFLVVAAFDYDGPGIRSADAVLWVRVSTARLDSTAIGTGRMGTWLMTGHLPPHLAAWS